jgi:hypothetical protein
MIGRPTARRAVAAAIASVSLLTSTHAASANDARRGREVPRHVCRFHWQRGTWHIKQLIRCAARRWNSPGTPRKAISVARCESGLDPAAYNAGGYAGLFQQATRYWPGRAARFGQPDRSVYNARANIIVSIRMARALGSWSAWGGCA